MVYILLFVALFLGFFLLRDYAGQGDDPLQALMESIASILALTIGIIGMVRFYSLLSVLEQANRAAEEANRSKGRFLANTSHEIRSPMYVIMGMTRLALKTKLSSEQREYLEAVQLSANALLKVINDVLDFSKIEAGRLDINPVPFDLRDSLGSLIKPLAVRAKENGLELDYDIRPDVPNDLLGDPERLRQIITNLVDNSIKFTREGKIDVFVEVESWAGEEGCLHFSVADTGIGIPGEKQQLIFEPFEQGDGSMTRTYGGTGLGLSIAKQLVELMGGRLWVESREGHGSTFHFTMPFHSMSAHAAPQALSKVPVVATPESPKDDLPDVISDPLPKDRKSFRILLAEDNAMSQVITSRILEERGYTVVVARDGRVALDVHEEQSFNLLLMDIQMPQIDGFKATSIIRRREKTTGEYLPIIAMTAYATEGTREQCLQAGMDAYISKPIKPEELYSVIERVVDR